jgi:hypothetical protein
MSGSSPPHILTAALEHEERFPLTRLSAGYGFRKETSPEFATTGETRAHATPAKSFEQADVEKDEAPMRLGERLGVSLHIDLDGFLTRMNLDANRPVVEIHLMAQSVCFSNNGMRHYRPALKGSATTS